MIKHLVQFFLLLVVFLLAGMVSQIHLDGQSVFLACFSLSLIVFIGLVAYLKLYKKQKIFVATLLALLIGINFASPAYAVDVSKLVYKADSEQGKELIEKIGNNGSRLSRIEVLAQYHDIMDGTIPPDEITLDGDDLKVAQETLTYCYQVDGWKGFGKTEQACQNAQAVADIAGKISNTLGKGCSPINVMIKNLVNKKQCWPCDITMLVIASIQSVAESAYPATSAAALNLLGALFLLWLAFVTVTFFGKFGFARISEYLTNVLTKGVLVLIMALFLHLPALELYKLTVSPFIAFTAELAETFSDVGRVEAKRAGKVLNILKKIMNLGSNSECKYCEGSGYKGSTAFLDAESVNGLLCVVCTVYHQVSPMIVLGQGLSCFADVSKVSNSGSSTMSAEGTSVIPRMGSLLTGAMIIMVFSFMMIIIAYYIVVSVLQLGFVIVLFPFWLVAFVFKATREYTKNAWGLVMNSMVSLIALSLSVALVLIGFSKLLSGKLALSLGLALVMGRPIDVMGAFSGIDTLVAESQNKSSIFDGLTDTLIKMAIDSVVGMSPIQAVMLLVAYAFLSVSMINGSVQFVERLLSIWLNRSADPHGTIMDGIKKAGKGLQGMATMSSAVAGVAANAAMQKAREHMKHEKWDPHLSNKAAEDQAKAVGMTTEQFEAQQIRNDNAMKKEEEKAQAEAKKAAKGK